MLVCVYVYICIYIYILLMLYKVSVIADYISIHCENCRKRTNTLWGEGSFLVLQRVVHVVTAGICE
jgi:hypothetical protein